MDTLLGCGGALLALFILLAPIASFVIALKNRREIAELRAAVERLRTPSAADAAPPPAAAAEAEALPPRPVEAAPPPAEPTFPDLAPEPQLAGPTPEPASAATEELEERTAPLALPRPAPAGPGLEERLGARLPVWLGAIALALAGIFLVQYSVEQGWLSEIVRTALALLFGVGLLAGGEALRGRSRGIASALSAAGIADLYAALLAGVHLYELIPPGLGFGLMALNTAVAVLLALRQGPLPAALGLVGGFLTPLWIGGEARSLAGLLGYLLLLDAGLLAVAWRRRWPLLGFGALGATALWAIALVSAPLAPRDSLLAGGFLLATGVLFGYTALRHEGAAAWGSARASRGLVEASSAGGLVLLAVLVGRGAYATGDWLLFGVAVAGSLAIARWREVPLFWVAPRAAAVTFVLFAIWGYSVPAEDGGRYLATLGALTALLAGGGYAAQRSSSLAARWAALASSAWVAFPLLAALSVREVGDAVWAAVLMGLGALAVVGALPWARHRAAATVLGASDAVVGAWAAAATALATLALAFALERAWLSVAFAVEAALLVWLGSRLRLAILGRLALGAFGIALVRLVLNPEVLRYPIGSLPIANWLLWGFGVPALAGFWAARRSRGDGVERHARLFEGGAVLFAAAGATLSAWHLAVPEALPRALEVGGLRAWTAQSLAWLALGIAFVAAARGFTRPVFAYAGRLLVSAGALSTCLGAGAIENPAWSSNPVGAIPVLNYLLVALGAPIVLLLAAARRVERDGGRRLPLVARIVSGALLFLLATLEVRQLFRGSDLAAGVSTPAEGFAYSVTWALLGTVLLALGVLRARRGLRLAALAVMLIAVLKVFLIDASVLTGLYRVLSFLGLGAALLVLATLYQRFVFRREEGAG